MCEGPLHPLGHEALGTKGFSQGRKGVGGQVGSSALSGQAQQMPHEYIPLDLLTLDLTSRSGIVAGLGAALRGF